MKTYILFLALLMGAGWAGCDRQPTGLSVLRQEILEDLTENILPFWSLYSPDDAGGFHGQIEFDGSPRPGAEKGGVLHARILWTFSTAYRLFGDESYKQLADRAQRYFLDYFVDPDHGGTYWSIRADGTPGNTEKQTYGMAYAIYGLAEHYRATGDYESLQAAIDIYRTLEEYAFDPEYGGYMESFTRDWEPPERYGCDGKGIAAKTMNTHLHVLEAYTGLYRVWPDPDLREQLEGIIHVFTTYIIDPQTWHQKLFFTREWQNLEMIDSYGHDIELAWLITEAAEVLHDRSLMNDIKYIAVQLTDTQLKEGWTADGAMLYEKAGDHIQANLDWWPQAESVVGFINAWQLTGDEKYSDAAVKTWEWIKANLIDHEFGEWFRTVTEDGIPSTRAPKGSLWKCPYHNSRMGFEMYERLKAY